MLGFSVFAGARRELIEHVLERARKSRGPQRIGYLNAAQVNRASADPAFARTLRSMDLLYADGQSIVWAGRRSGATLPERLTAADFIEDFLRRAASLGVSIALVGGQPGSAASFSAFWRNQIPGLEFRYVHDGTFSDVETDEILDEIRRSHADVVLIGMGAPRQERLAEAAAGDGHAGVWWCVGALFEYGSWGKRRAPLWMRRSGLEWAFRLAQEPRRLAVRYLIGNPVFVWRVLTRSR